MPRRSATGQNGEFWWLAGLDHLLRYTKTTQAIKASQSTTFRRCYGSEFISRDMDLWAYQRGVTLDFSRPGKPTDNAFIEAFNSKLRGECLNTHWFMSREDACEKIEDWPLSRHLLCECTAGQWIKDLSSRPSPGPTGSADPAYLSHWVGRAAT